MVLLDHVFWRKIGTFLVPKWQSSSFTSQPGSPARLSPTQPPPPPGTGMLQPGQRRVPRRKEATCRRPLSPRYLAARGVLLCSGRGHLRQQFKQGQIQISNDVICGTARKAGQRQAGSELQKDGGKIDFGKILTLFDFFFFPIEKARNFENEMFFYLIKGRIIQNTWGVSHLFFWPSFFQAKKGRNRNTKLKWASTHFHCFLLLFLKRFQ